MQQESASIAAPRRSLSPEVLARLSVGGFVLLAHGVLTAAMWGALFSRGHAPQHAIGAVLGVLHAAAAVPLLLRKEKIVVASVFGAGVVWLGALLLGIAWHQTEVSGFHAFWGITILALVSGAPGKVRVTAAACVLAMLDVVFVFGAVLRLTMPLQ